MKTDYLGQELASGDTVITIMKDSPYFIRGSILVLLGKMASCDFGKHSYMVSYNALVKIPKSEPAETDESVENKLQLMRLK